ncbi:MAG: BtpA/SgcQ family protein [Pseudobdellovibrio sp.]
MNNVSLLKLGSHKKKIWFVGYMNAGIKECLLDAENAYSNGADAVIFEGHDYKKMDIFFTELREKFPHEVMGVNFLGPDENLYTAKETFELAQKHKLQIAWTDFSGLDLINKAKEISLHYIEDLKPKGVFYISGIHMKYSNLIDKDKPIEKSALQAMGWVDGIVITGSKTGVAIDPEKAIRVRQVIGDYPMGIASGVSSENVKSIISVIDYVVVNSSIADGNHRLIPEKLKELRKVMGN